eukprot:scaffold8601_cov191-Amphora_coffeaeformis.AAC.7
MPPTAFRFQRAISGYKRASAPLRPSLVCQSKFERIQASKIQNQLDRARHYISETIPTKNVKPRPITIECPRSPSHSRGDKRSNTLYCHKISIVDKTLHPITTYSSPSLKRSDKT